MADVTLCNQIRVALNQTGSDIFWPANQIYDAANEALLMLWAKNEQQGLVSTPFAVTTATDIYTWGTSTVMIPKYVILNSTSTTSVVTNQMYFITDMTKLEQYARAWQVSNSGQPKWFMLWDFFHLRVYPKPDTNYTFTLFGIAWPTEISGGNEDATVDRMFKQGIAYRAAATLLEATRPDVADTYTTASDQIINRYNMRVRNQQRNNLRRLKPGGNNRGTDKTIAAQTGVIKLGRSLS